MNKCYICLALICFKYLIYNHNYIHKARNMFLALISSVTHVLYSLSVSVKSMGTLTSTLYDVRYLERSSVLCVRVVQWSTILCMYTKAGSTLLYYKH